MGTYCVFHYKFSFTERIKYQAEGVPNKLFPSYVEVNQLVRVQH